MEILASLREIQSGGRQKKRRKEEKIRSAIQNAFVSNLPKAIRRKDYSKRKWIGKRKGERKKKNIWRGKTKGIRRKRVIRRISTCTSLHQPVPREVSCRETRIDVKSQEKQEKKKRPTSKAEHSAILEVINGISASEVIWLGG